MKEYQMTSVRAVGAFAAGVGLCSWGRSLLSASDVATFALLPTLGQRVRPQLSSLAVQAVPPAQGRTPAGGTATSSAAAAVVLLGVAGRSSARKRTGHILSRRSQGLGTPTSKIVADEEPKKDEPKAPSAPPVRMPMISTGAGSIDVMSRLLKDRVLILSGQVNDEMANVIVAQLLYLANEDKEKDITVYINSPGGSVSAGMAMYDAMQFVPCDVSTVCFGLAASMGAFLLGAGTKGKRKCLPNARVMIHQPLGGAGGQAADIEIQAKEILFLRECLNTYLSDFTGKSMETIEADCDRDYFMTPEEAVEYGLIDEVVKTKTWPRLQKPPKPDL